MAWVRSTAVLGFRWLFIIEGVITLLSALLLWFCLSDYPARAKWLNELDTKFAIDRLKKRGGGYNRDDASRQELWATINPRMLIHYSAYIADIVPQGSFTFFTATIVTGLGYESVSRTAPNYTTVGRRLRRCHHALLLCRPFQRQWLAHSIRIRCGRHWLAHCRDTKP